MPVYLRAPPSSTSACASCNACRHTRPGIPCLSPLSLRLFCRAVVPALSSLHVIAATRRYCRAVVAALMSPRNFRRPLALRRCLGDVVAACRCTIVAAPLSRRCRLAVVAAPLSRRCRAVVAPLSRCCHLAVVAAPLLPVRLSPCLCRCPVASAPLSLPVAAPLLLCRCGRAIFATLSAIRRAVGAAPYPPSP